MLDRTAPAVSLIVLVAALAAIHVRPTTDSSAASADDLWALAILHSVPHDEGDSRVVIDLYHKAIHRAEAKAPLLVALGDFYRGPLVIQERMEPLYEAAEQGRGFNREMDAVVSTSGGNDQCIACYVAATRADPDYVPAWFRLAVFADGDVSLDAIHWLQEHAPDNALGWYLEAAHHLKARRIEQALDLVERGNEGSGLTIYSPPLPARWGVVYPDVYEGAAGKPVPTSAMAFLARLPNEAVLIADPLIPSLRSLAYGLLESADASAVAGNALDAERKAIAAYGLALQMVRCDPPVAILSFQGTALTGDTLRLLRKLLPGDDPRLIRFEQTQDSVRTYLRLVKEQLVPAIDKIRQADQSDIWLGKIAPVDIETATLHQIRAESGVSQIAQMWP